MKEHEDFQEKIQLSANIKFEFSKEQNFKGLDTFETEIKKRVKKNIPVENVSLKQRNSLF